MIESLSDSTIYFAYYTVAHLLQGNITGSTPPKKVQQANNSHNQQIPINHSLSSNNTIERKKCNSINSNIIHKYLDKNYTMERLKRKLADVGNNNLNAGNMNSINSMNDYNKKASKNK